MRACLLIAVSGCGFRSPAGVADAAPADAHADATSDATTDASAAIDFVIEAEAFTATQSTTSHGWTSVTGVAGFSGASFMQITPANGSACDPVSTIASGCATWIRYDLMVPEQATYHVHLRMYAVDASDDSVWYGIDGTPDATDLDPPHDSTWHWMTAAPTFTLPRGRHTLTLWQREAGARIDVVGVTRSASPPP